MALSITLQTEIAPSQLFSLAEAAVLVRLSHSHLRHLASHPRLWSIKKGKS